MTVWRVLKKHQVKAVVKRRKKSDYIRYSKEIPGERVQLDVMKVRNGAYQFTAIDDCTRLRTIRVRSEAHTSELHSRQYLVCRLLLEKRNAIRSGRNFPDN